MTKKRSDLAKDSGKLASKVSDFEMKHRERLADEERTALFGAVKVLCDREATDSE